MLTPKFKQNLIVGIKYSYKFRWYVLPSSLCFLDLNKLKPSTKDYYMSHHTFKGIRENCQTCSTIKELDEYITSIKAFWVSTEQLSNMLAHASKGQKFDYVNDFCPSLYFNYDEKTLYTANNDFTSYSKCLPDGWTSFQKNFLEIVPTKHQFWKLI